MSDTIAQALMWLATFGIGIGVVGLVAWLKSNSEDSKVSKTLKRLDKR